MIYKKELGKELKKKIDSGISNEEIGKWAFQIYFYHGRYFDSELDDIFQSLFMMEEGPEFEFSKEELEKLADSLINSH